MIIVLEGPDLGGKSTLARALAGVTDLSIIHHGPPQRHPLYEYEPRGATPAIYDRLHLGETIYGPLLRGESKLDEVQLQHTSAYLRARGALVVLVQPRLATIRKRYTERGDELLSWEQIQRVYGAYDMLIGTRYRDLSLQTDTPTDFTQLIRDTAMTTWLEAEPVRETYGLRTYVGPRHPKVLLVGDKRQHGDESAFDSAFVPLPSNSGHFLLTAVAAARQPHHECWWDVGLMNANESRGDDLYEAWRVLGHPRIVALGANAHNKLAHLRIPHGAAPHPQWCRRFFHSHQEEYGRIVIRSLETQEDLRGWRPANA